MARKTIIPIITITLLIILAQGCQVSVEKPNPVSMSSYDDLEIYYTFEPAMFFTASEQDQEAMFQPISSEEYPRHDLYPAGFFPWKQQDYLEIANVLNHVVVSDALSDWKVYDMTFVKDCVDTPVGFDGVIVVYFKFDGTRYESRRIDISPQVKAAQWRGTLSFPRSSPEWKSVDIDNFKVTADDALQIAEANGGQDTRRAVKNNCYVSVSIPNMNYEGWEVEYSSGGTTTIFKIDVDPLTGKYKIVKPRK